MGIFGLSTFTFPNELESKPPPFEDHKGWGTRKSQTSPSALGYRSGTIQPREFLNRKTRKDGPPAEMCDQTKDVSDRIKELGDKATQLLTFLSFALAVGVLLETSRDHALAPPQKILVTTAIRCWVIAIFPILIGILPWREFTIIFGCKEPSWGHKIHLLKFLLLWIAVPTIIFGAFEFCRAIWWGV